MELHFRISPRAVLPEAVVYLPTPIGKLYLAADPDGLTAVTLTPGPEVATGHASREAFAILEKAARELDEYFAGSRRVFDLPLSLGGTPFQRSVWQSLCAIPYGETRSYAEVAAMTGRPKACRAVGMANHNNPVMLLIPCHRVIQTGGGLGGYGGGLPAKQYLLDLEAEIARH